MEKSLIFGTRVNVRNTNTSERRTWKISFIQIPSGSGFDAQRIGPNLFKFIQIKRTGKLNESFFDLRNPLRLILINCYKLKLCI
jgi:hypothetical protein